MELTRRRRRRGAGKVPRTIQSGVCKSSKKAFPSSDGPFRGHKTEEQPGGLARAPASSFSANRGQSSSVSLRTFPARGGRVVLRVVFKKPLYVLFWKVCESWWGASYRRVDRIFPADGGAFFPGREMVGRLNLQPNACEGDPLDMSCRAERGLDSPDSGLPPSPSPSAWLLQPVCAYKPGGVSPVSEDEGRGSLVPVLPCGSLQQLQPLSYGEGIALDPLPSKEIRFTSSVHYDSDRHFIQGVALRPVGQGLEHCRQTVVAVPHSTWRHYKTQLDFQPRHRPQCFKSTTIVYPKKTSALYATELSYDCRRLSKRFTSSVEMETTARREIPQ
ncbi:refilin-B isoform X1 [Gasterosteus aculeatus]